MPHKTTAEGTRVPTRRALNRALVARQLLLERAPLGPVEATAQAAGLQALVLEPFAAIAPADRAALEAEGEAMLRSAEPEVITLAVHWRELTA